MEELKLVAKGAEADLWLDNDWNGTKVLIKRRGVKKYRNPELDNKIRRTRTIREASIIQRAKKAGVPTPTVYQVDLGAATIVMEFVDGYRVRDIVDKMDELELYQLFHYIGKLAGDMHKVGIIHGDLTTSNIIKNEDRVVFIDFGLAEISFETEKRGVDLNLMHRMLTSTHFMHTEDLFTAFKEGYRITLGFDAEDAIKRLKIIRTRGRYIDRG